MARRLGVGLMVLRRVVGLDRKGVQFYAISNVSRVELVLLLRVSNWLPCTESEILTGKGCRST